ncbi:ABC-2 type transport system permease protein [Crossiella equi]|uniref:ABC-2 type transport system permease protein n=1 Tax=Crossiella equi TaxID=130796 RepID=A0ABS5AGH5_9PSEU|nr:ABC-2 family transporter protein [Crossiella equi]MBP2474760.1 ABC-2 type transport system permease protein [Crossiella equi]
MRSLPGPYPRMVLAGFRRYSSYRQATLAGLATNVVFGLLRVSVLFAVLDGQQQVAGYDQARSATYVWLGQGLLALVVFWGHHEIAERIRSGDVVVDLTRPWNLRYALFAEDLGRAGHAFLTRFLPPVCFGVLLFPFQWPRHWLTWLLFPVSLLLAVWVSFAARLLLAFSAFWLLDNRGPVNLYGILVGVLGGLIVPLWFLPEGVRQLLYLTPFPALGQDPVDVFTEAGPVWVPLLHQLVWVLVLMTATRWVLERARYKVVVQGG